MSGIDEAPLTSPGARNRAVLDLFLAEQFYGEWYHNVDNHLRVSYLFFVGIYSNSIFEQAVLFGSRQASYKVILHVISSTPHHSASHWALARMYLKIPEGFGRGIPFNIHCLWHA